VTTEWWVVLGSAVGVGVMSGAVPVAVAEATALAAAAVPTPGLRIAVLVAFTAGHVAGKALWYWLGTLETRVSRPSLRAWIDRAHTYAAEHPSVSLGVTFSSATISLPPFHLTAIAAGIVRAPLATFLATAFAGRLVRFSAIAAFPAVVRYLF
jgi:membrane protein YqaA with SNARE-associated domain